MPTQRFAVMNRVVAPKWRASIAAKLGQRLKVLLVFRRSFASNGVGRCRAVRVESFDTSIGVGANVYSAYVTSSGTWSQSIMHVDLLGAFRSRRRTAAFGCVACACICCRGRRLVEYIHAAICVLFTTCSD